MYQRLTDRDRAKAKKYTSSVAQSVRVPVAACGSEVSFADIKLVTLRPGVWLNDEVINAYTSLVFHVGGLPRDGMHASTFFGNSHWMPSYVMANQAADWFSDIKSWTLAKALKKLFEDEAATHILHHKSLVFPIHVNGDHWVLLHIIPSKGMVHIYDSMLPVVVKDGVTLLTVPVSHARIIALAKHWVEKQMRNHDGVERFRNQDIKILDLSKWDFMTVMNCPQQIGYQDCGVFLCMFVRYVALGYPFDFTSADVGNLRVAIACELGRLSLRRRSVLSMLVKTEGPVHEEIEVF